MLALTPFNGLILAAIFACAWGGTSHVYSLKDSHPIPDGWTHVGRAPAYHLIDLQIGLRQNRFDELAQRLLEVSDPFHPLYGQHLTEDEVSELVKPSEETDRLVHVWLLGLGVRSEQLQYSKARDFVFATLPVHQIERLLMTKYSVYEHDQGTTVIRCPAWSLPNHLHKHISVIQPTNAFFYTTSNQERLQGSEKSHFEPEYFQSQQHDDLDVPNDNANSPCSQDRITLDCIRQYYGTKSYVPRSDIGNAIGVTNYLGLYANRSNVRTFLAKYRPQAVQAASEFKIVKIDHGTTKDTLDDSEGDFDAEFALGMTYPIPLTTYCTGGRPPFLKDPGTPSNTNEPYMAWLNYVLNQTNTDIPNVISSSYADDEQTVPQSYAEAVCNQFAQLGARGKSMFVASGDAGVGNVCLGRGKKARHTFIPSFPSTCPYVTSVGATHRFNPEIAASFSGSGFSSYFERPKYQGKVVGTYTKGIGNLNKGLFDPNGRTYPDISAQGVNIAFFKNAYKKPLPFTGTSASTPIAASIFSLINDDLITRGMPPLGFLNPFIYAVGNQGFKDITGGVSIGCDIRNKSRGFPVTRGWDPVTGFGTPEFNELRKLATSAAQGKFRSGV